MQSKNIKQRIKALKKAIEYTGGTISSLARALEVSRPLVSTWNSGKRPISLKYAIEIEKITHGLVKAEDLLTPLNNLKKYREKG